MKFEADMLFHWASFSFFFMDCVPAVMSETESTTLGSEGIAS